jgi:hypothetical protein
MSRAVVATAGATALIASPAAAGGPQRGSGARGGDHYTIVVKVDGGGQSTDEVRIAEAVRREIAAIEREKSARERSSFSDYSA